MSVVGECVQVARVLFHLLIACQDAKTNKMQCGFLVGRRNQLITEMLSVRITDQAMNRLLALDQEIVKFIRTFEARRFVFKMLFSKSDHNRFQALDKALDRMFSDFNLRIHRQASFQQALMDDYRMKIVLVENNRDLISLLPAADKLEIMASFAEYLPIVQSAAELESASIKNSLEVVSSAFVVDAFADKPLPRAGMFVKTFYESINKVDINFVSSHILHLYL